MDAEAEARRVARRALHRGGVEVEPTQLRFACAQQCLGCGRLALAPAHPGDPMRSDAQGWRRLPCSGCGANTWVDLAQCESAAALRDAERREIELRRGMLPAIAGLLASVGLVVFVLVAAATVWLVTPPLVALVVAGGLASAAFSLRRVVAGLQTPRRRAWRWHVPTREAVAARMLSRDEPAKGPVGVAPISGRAALAWRVEVRYPGDRGDAFALLDQDLGQLELVGAPVPAASTIETAATEVEAESEDARRYLLSRGLDPNDSLYVVERIIVPGARVSVWEDRDGAGVILREPSPLPALPAAAPG